ncbi:MAG: ABC transporter permease [Lachnospirales bacterium]
MTKYVIQRIIMLFITLFVLSFIIFVLLDFMPGSPFNNPKLSQEQIRIMEDNYGLNEPLFTRYVKYIGNVLKGDFGVSFKYSNVPVLDMLKSPLKVTIQVGLSAVFLGTFIGIIFGSIAAIYNGTWVDSFVSLISILGTSIPSFVLATFMIRWTVDIPWIPVTYASADAALGITKLDEIKSMILPVITISAYIISSVMRYTRTELIEVLNSDYILLARAKGVKNSKVIFKHALRNALIPIITVVGPMTLYAITGSTVSERFFGVPGLAQQLINAVNTNDYFLIMGISLFYAAMLIIVLLVVDLLYGVIDPRVRVSGGSGDE